MWKLAIGFVAAMILAGAASAGQFDKQIAESYRLDAEKGDAQAQVMFGYVNLNGIGVPPNHAEAMKWYRMAAEQSTNNLFVLDARNTLGVIYDNGEGVPQDFAEAVKWFRMAAEQGYPLAQGNLGLMYAKGRGVLQDYVIAHMWLNLAAAKNAENAVHNRDWVAARMTSDQVAEAQRLAREWRPAVR